MSFIEDDASSLEIKSCRISAAKVAGAARWRIGRRRVHWPVNVACALSLRKGGQLNVAVDALASVTRSCLTVSGGDEFRGRTIQLNSRFKHPIPY